MLPILLRISRLHDPCETIPMSSQIPGIRKPSGLPDLLHVSSHEWMVQIVSQDSIVDEVKRLPPMPFDVRIPKMGDLVTRGHPYSDGPNLFQDFHYEFSRPLVIRNSEIPKYETLIQTPPLGFLPLFMRA